MVKQSEFITCYLMGGLGNQLFQLFAVIAYAFRNNRKFLFTYDEFLGQRQTYWDSFLKPLSFFTTRNPHHNKTNQTLTQYANLFREPGFKYSPIPSFFQETVLLYGYYQSYLYFKDQEDTIFKLIRLSNQQTEIREEYASYFEQDKTIISMHFRLGDYKNLPDHYNILPLSYYNASLQLITSSNAPLKNKKVLYFCEKEDLEYVKYHYIHPLSQIYNTENVEFVKADDSIADWKQMLLMSVCDHNIIANSTFSWWGAYFNQNKEKIVCYPSQWFGPALANKNDISDLFPPNWNKVIV